MLSAIITGVEGPSYRNPGTLMCLFPDGTASGSLTNGCIEAALALHAQTALRSGRPLRLRYGIGSPFFDIRLPCGGGLDICLFPLRDRTAVADAAFVLQGRAAVGLAFAPDGTMRLAPAGPSGWSGGTFVLTLVPQPQATIFGDGLEAQALARLFHAAGFRHLLAANGGHGALCLADPWTAIVMRTAPGALARSSRTRLMRNISSTPATRAVTFGIPTTIRGVPRMVGAGLWAKF